MAHDSRTPTRIKLLAGVLALMVLALLGRLWYLQIVKGEDYARTSFENRLRIEKLVSPRGIIYDRNGVPMVRNTPYYYAAIRPGMAEKADIVKIADFLNIKPEDVIEQVKANTNPFEEIVIKGGIPFDEVTFIESRMTDYPELMIGIEETRNYLYGELAAHVIGYLGKLNPQQSHLVGLLAPESFVGQWGVEKLYDDTLRGVPGERVIEVDALGRMLRVVEEKPSKKGQDLYLSIDLDMQRAAEAAMGNNAGALVAIKPSTGEVLALVSKPSFDPNLFSRGINYADWVRLSDDPMHPMLNRALQSAYPPGSTFKLMTAVAALEDNAITTSTTFGCSGGLRSGARVFRCWNKKGHGTVSIHRAISESCDVFFYHTGERVGMDEIARYARMFGLGQETGLALVPEKKGLIPDTTWKMRVRKEPWYTGETYISAIGQGYVLTTPAQLALMAATLSNGGRRFPLSIVRLDQPPKPTEVINLKPGTAATVLDGMRGVVGDPSGTGQAARTPMIKVGGKTGTAQVVTMGEVRKSSSSLPYELRDHAWFIAIAPVDNPDIAMAILVEHGGGGGAVAAPIARKTLEGYLTRAAERKDAMTNSAGGANAAR